MLPYVKLMEMLLAVNDAEDVNWIALVLEHGVSWAVFLIVTVAVCLNWKKLKALADVMAFKKVSFLGIEVEVEQLERVAPKNAAPVPRSNVSGAVQRAMVHKEALKRMRVVWVNPEIRQDEGLKDVLRRYGIQVETVRTASEAVERDDLAPYHVVVTNNSDVCIEGQPAKLGVEVAERMRGRSASVLWYITNIDNDRGFPVNVNYIENRPEGLLHALCDVAERWYYKSAVVGR